LPKGAVCDGYAAGQVLLVQLRLYREAAFCDGAHERLNTGMTPVEMEIKYPKTVAWCGCRRTAKPPLCDGAHNKL